MKRLDISKFAEAALNSPKAVQDFLYQVAMLTPGVLFLYDLRNRKLLFANDQLYQVLGYSLSEINSFKGNFRKFLIHPEDYENRHQQGKKSRKSSGDKSITVESRLKKKSGEYIHVRVKSLLLKRSGKDSTLMLGMIEDITQSKQIHAQQENEKLQSLQTERLAALNDMAGGIAHEINNPLAIILGRAQSMKMRLDRGIVDPAHLADGLEKIEKTVHRISEIISALRLVTRDGSKDPFVPTQIDHVLKDVKTVWNQRLINHGVEFTVESIDPQLTVICRPSQIATALINLISNSYQAVKTVQNPKITVCIRDNGDHVEIDIIDNGVGVAPPIRDRIFNAFFTTKPVGEGSGLGLTIAAGVMKDHHGELFLDPQTSVTKFVMKLPKNIYLKKPLAA